MTSILKAFVKTVYPYIAIMGLTIGSAMLFANIMVGYIEDNKDLFLPSSTPRPLPTCIEENLIYSDWSTCSIDNIEIQEIEGIKVGANCKIGEGFSARTQQCEYKPKYILAENEQKISLISEPLSLWDIRAQEGGHNPKVYPEVTVNSANIDKALLRLYIDFDPRYVDTAYNYIHGRTKTGTPANHFYSLKYFIGSIANGGYVDVIRSASGEVLNYPDGGLYGSYKGTDILGGREFVIDLEKVSVATDEYQKGLQYTYMYPLKDIKDSVGSTIRIGAFLSDIDGTLIKEMEIIYVGDEGAIESYN